MSSDKEAAMPGSPVFWTALWAGMAAPVYVYAVPCYYPIYGSPAGIGDSFAVVGLQLGQALRAVENERLPPVTAGHPAAA